VVTAEEHQKAGGLGDAVAGVLARNHPSPQEYVGVRNTFGESGTPKALLEKYGLTSTAIVEAAKKAMARAGK
jgi:transketolase